MISKILFHGIPLVLPFLAYGLWMYVVRRKMAAAAAANKGLWNDAPWTWLMIAGFGLMIASLFAVGFLSGDDPTGTYIPPHVVDGVLIPSQVQ